MIFFGGIMYSFFVMRRRVLARDLCLTQWSADTASTTTSTLFTRCL